MPEVNLIHVPEPAYLVKRFDRSLENKEVKRLHVIDACQLLSLDRAFKYTQCLPDTLTVIVEQCRAKAVTRKLLFDWFVFCLLIGNTDNHLKNLSFYMSPEGVVITPYPAGISKEGELRLLRQVHYGVIADMAARLAV